MEQRDIIELSSRKRDEKIMRAGRDYVVGIDTGGTFTDGVLLDYYSRDVINSCKTLTTREDLSIGIIKALTGLNIENPSRIRLVGISSTLATNSIAENRVMETALLLVGYDRELIETYHLEAKFPTKNIAYFAGGHTSQGEEKEALDIAGICQWVETNRNKVDALAISSYFSPLNPSHEEEVFAAIQGICSLPVVLGHQLSTKIDSISRATTACLNASLVAVMQGFIQAVQTALEKEKISAPLMIVKGDGSLMPYDVATAKPVETILSGPAASAIGGRFLSGNDSAVVVDVGGTTTDIALIENGQMTISTGGTRVGNVQTAVKAARIRTACIGCDSRISFDKGKTVKVGPDRVVPLCRLAALFPSVEKQISALPDKHVLDWLPTDIEYWFLYKDVDCSSHFGTDTRHAELFDLLRQGPLSVTHILKHMKVNHIVQLNAAALIEKRLIERAYLTPTDLLHVIGHMNQWNAKVARIALQRACEMHDRNPETFAQETLSHIVHRMAEEVMTFLARQQEGQNLPEEIDDKWGRWFINEMLTDGNPYLSVSTASRFPVIGIGAPAGYFVRRLARCLNAPFVLPKSAAVANAVGAVAGSVCMDEEARIFLKEIDNSERFVVQIDGRPPQSFEEKDDAKRYAQKIVSDMAKEAAIVAGVISPQVAVQESVDGSVLRLVARALGNPSLGPSV